MQRGRMSLVNNPYQLLVHQGTQYRNILRVRERSLSMKVKARILRRHHCTKEELDHEDEYDEEEAEEEAGVKKMRTRNQDEWLKKLQAAVLSTRRLTQMGTLLQGRQFIEEKLLSSTVMRNKYGGISQLSLCFSQKHGYAAWDKEYKF